MSRSTLSPRTIGFWLSVAGIALASLGLPPELYRDQSLEYFVSIWSGYLGIAIAAAAAITLLALALSLGRIRNIGWRVFHILGWVTILSLLAVSWANTPLAGRVIDAASEQIYGKPVVMEEGAAPATPQAAPSDRFDGQPSGASDAAPPPPDVASSSTPQASQGACGVAEGYLWSRQFGSMAAADIAGARSRGFPDNAIADFLIEQAKLNVACVRKSGYTDLQIIEHLTGKFRSE